jgi:hypothetical protein
MLSEPLRDEIYSHIYKQAVEDCPPFSKFETHIVSQITKQFG